MTRARTLSRLAYSPAEISEGAVVAGITTIDASGFNITGVATATSFSGNGSSLTFNTINVSGIATFGADVSIAGTITYDDVTNIDSVGIVTAGKGLRATTGGLIVTAGVSTFGANAKIGPWNEVSASGEGFTLRSNGQLLQQLKSDTTETSGYVLQKGTTAKVTFTPDGAATFAADATINGLTVGLGLAEVASNTVVGKDALDANTTGVNNTAIGHNALGLNTTGSYLTAHGYQALYSNTSGDHNTAIGWKALYTNDDGNDNTAVGYQALWMNEASSNVAVGLQALRSNSTGDENIGVGRKSLYTNTTGKQNTAVGSLALFTNSTADYNTAVGNEALYSNDDGHSNTAVGHQALKSNSGGDRNTAVGEESLLNNTASYNTAVGANSLKANTAGTYNCGLGDQTLLSNTDGVKNIAIGYNALTDLDGGDKNVACGHEAGYESTTASFNVAVGYQALYTNITSEYHTAVGYQALKLATGSKNTACGSNAGNSITTGGHNTCIGYDADVSSATVNGEVVLGDSNVGTLRCNTQTISTLSDARDKTEVEPSPLGVDFLNKLNPVKFKWDTREGNIKDGTHEIGFIAQELQAVQVSSNTEYLKMIIDENPDRLEASYGQLVPILVQAIKELSAQVKELQTPPTE